VLTVSEKAEDYGRGVEEKLKAAGFRAAGDYRPEKIGAKVREASLEKVPYMLVVGERDAAAGTVALRDRADGKEERDQSAAAVVERLRAEVAEKRIRGVSTATAGLVDSTAKYEG
jgi:threonyl-tRNA synthetase